MSYGILLLRVVFGLTLAAHGGQKLFGWFGGQGPSGTSAFLRQLGFRAPVAMAALVGTAEMGGGLLLALGLATPLAALVVAVVMLNAIVAVHLKNGFWNVNGGWEMNLFVLTVAIALTATGPLRYSLDHAFGWAGDITGLWWAVGVLGVAVVVSALTLTRRTRPATHLRRAA
jgi:putative oxidoreductase